MAQADTLLKIDSIEGESQDKDLPKTIEIQSWSAGVTHSGSFGSGTGGGTGKAQFQDLHFTKSADKASVKIAKACATGQHIKEAVLVIRKAGGPSTLPYLTITMTNVRVTSFQTSGHGSGGTSEQFSLNFEKIKYSYQAQDEKGAKKDGAIDFEHNVASGKDA